MKLHLILGLVLISALCGCESRAKARARAQAAYAAGRASAYREMHQAQRTSVRIIGNVKTGELPWEEGLTLARAMLMAEYRGSDSPRTIFVNRNGVRMPVSVEAFLKGHDVILEPGDIVEIND